MRFSVLHNHRITYILFLFLIVSVTLGCGMLSAQRERPPRPPTIEELHAVAQRDTHDVSTDPDASLGQPYEWCVLPADALDRYRAPARMGVFLECGGWQVPVLVDGKVCGEVHVEFAHGNWRSAGTSRPPECTGFLRLLLDFTANPEHATLDTPVLVAFHPPAGIFALFNKGCDEQFLQLSGPLEPPHAMHLYRTDEVMQKMIEVYESKGGW
jgi:hypothetical protein